MNLKNRVGIAANQCATSKGLIKGASLYITQKGAIKKELSKKDKEYAHVYVENDKLKVDYAEKKETKKAEAKADKPGKAKADKA
jgi:regulator of replication initiation timing